MDHPEVDKTTVVRNPVLRIILLTAGWILVFLAFLGAILPLLPTTPFLTLAAICFYKSSPKFYNWLMNNKLFGHYLRDYRDKKGIPVKVKVGTLLFTWITILISVVFFLEALWLKLSLIGIAVAVTIHILLLKTKRS
jgi:uncharacterized protein